MEPGGAAFGRPLVRPRRLRSRAGAAAGLLGNRGLRSATPRRASPLSSQSNTAVSRENSSRTRRRAPTPSRNSNPLTCPSSRGRPTQQRYWSFRKLMKTHSCPTAAFRRMKAAVMETLASSAIRSTCSSVTWEPIETLATHARGIRRLAARASQCFSILLGLAVANATSWAGGAPVGAERSRIR
jgi:hypothetical protein